MMRKLVYSLLIIVVIFLVGRTINYATLVPEYSFTEGGAPGTSNWALPDFNFNYSFIDSFNELSDFSRSFTTSEDILDSLDTISEQNSDIYESTNPAVRPEELIHHEKNAPLSEQINHGKENFMFNEEQLETWRSQKFFACFDSGEAYGAAWFATRASIFQRTLSTGHREHMETAGSLGLAANTPLKTVDVLDFSVEHLSWLDRRLGLRDMKGEMKPLLQGELLEHMRLREVKTRTAALAKMEKEKMESLRRRKLFADGDIQSSPSVSNPEVIKEQAWYQPLSHENNSKERKPLSILGVFPYFATRSHCEDTDVTNKGGTFVRCDSGSSDPLMRRYFLNLTFWATHYSITTDIALSVCSDDDENFARNESGLPFYDVFRSNCRVFHPEFDKVVFKPGLLGVLTVMRLQERFLNDARFQKFTHVFYNEADQVIHSRLPVSVLAYATLPQKPNSASKSSKKHWPFPYVVPHRMQPISDPIDIPSLNKLYRGMPGIPRWVHDDIARVSSAKRMHFPPSLPTSSVDSMQGSCCLDRGECKTRKHWLKFKVTPEELDLHVMKIGDSLTMIAGEGDFGNLLFRNCTPSSEYVETCPS